MTLIEKPSAGTLDARRRRCGRSAAGERDDGCAAPCRSCFRTPTARSIRASKIGAILEEPLSSTPICRSRSGAAQALDMMAKVGLAAGALRALSAHVLRRPAPAHRDRARPDAAPEAAWSPTSRSRRSTSRCRRRCSTCSSICSASWGSPISSSRTISAVVAPHRPRRAGHVSRPRDGAGAKAAIFARPLHPYTQALLAATPGLAAGAARAIVPQGRAAFAARSAEGLRVLDPLPACDGSLPRRAPAPRALDGRQVACHFAGVVSSE